MFDYFAVHRVAAVLVLVIACSHRKFIFKLIHLIVKELVDILLDIRGDISLKIK